MRADEFDLIAFRRRFAEQPPPQVVLHQLDIFRSDEVGERLADHVGRRQIEQREKTRVGEQNAIAVHEHRVMDRFDQTLEQLLAIVQARAALFEVFQQLVDRGAQLAKRLGFPLEPDASRGSDFARKLPHLRGEFVDGLGLAALPRNEHGQADCQGGRGQKPQCGQDQRGPRYR